MAVTIKVRPVSECVIVGEHRGCPCHAGEDEHEQEAVGLAEDGVGEIFVSSDPVIAAAEETQAEREGPHQVAEDRRSGQ